MTQDELIRFERNALMIDINDPELREVVQECIIRLAGDYMDAETGVVDGSSLLPAARRMIGALMHVRAYIDKDSLVRLDVAQHTADEVCRARDGAKTLTGHEPLLARLLGDARLARELVGQLYRTEFIVERLRVDCHAVLASA